MSSKINVVEIVSGHFDTLKNSDGTRSYLDLLIFLFIPVGAGVVSFLFSFNLNTDLSSLLVNFGSIFVALLLSVLVLVYDQQSKLEDKKEETTLYNLKMQILKELYYNISYSILCAVMLVLACFIHSIADGFHPPFSIAKWGFDLKFDIWFITPFVVFVTANLFLNILMIVKRMHALLVSE